MHVAELQIGDAYYASHSQHLLIQLPVTYFRSKRKNYKKQKEGKEKPHILGQKGKVAKKQKEGKQNHLFQVTQSYAGAYSVLLFSLQNQNQVSAFVRMNQDEQPEHSPENDDEPEGEGAAGDADDHQQVVLD